MKKLQIGIGIFICSVHILCAQVPLPPVPSESSSVATGLEVGSALKHDVSPALRNISPLAEPADLGNREIFRGIPHPNSNSTSPDGAVLLTSSLLPIKISRLPRWGLGWCYSAFISHNALRGTASGPR